ncbi:6-hydroxy-D-nicotine oxidase [Streptomyces lavendulae subsp. lavendulae]|uniref:6-hydroxy-D-nicotine oxidase n=2 Tax=Streptomyces lavendulae TaxID=1914 RepID=A0A2K8P5L8_STRLA|nr:6-hydroxy-D-nicotine oxidase [Streptomyces lavendulae subsp. lavendulae]ATZ29522.1 6-hydroxy-D-nicotine oxidase [Streptomyces lavendulae subsp. lavendulae]
MTPMHTETLPTSLPGHWLAPEDPGYDEARRIWNGMHDRRPALIARCRDTGEVSLALRHAAVTGLDVTVRGGGHNVAGTALADGAVLIDLGPLSDVEVDPVAGIALAGGGALLRDVDAATTPYGLACPAGVVSHTGLGGLALGGGYGWLARKWGLTCDHILAAEVVLADGTVVETDEDNHPELLWALRGGGGNFGIVTRFTLRLRPVGPVHHHVGVYPLDQAVQALAAYRGFAERQGPDLHAVGCLKFAGDQEWIPVALRGERALFLTATWFGDPAEGPSRTASLFADVRPAAELTRLLSYAELQALGDHGEPHGNRYFTKSCYLAELSPKEAEEFAGIALDMPSRLSSVDFEYLRGAITDVPDEESAFPSREAPYICTVSSQWTDPGQDAVNTDWPRRAIERLAPLSTGGAYVNYLQDEHAGRVREVYGAARHARLAAVKNTYDPGNVLHRNQNIPPTADEQHNRSKES